MRIDEGQYLPRPRRRCPEQHLGIRVAAHNAVKRDDVGVGQRACDCCEIAKDKLGGT
jgi:hypothetical protein